MRQGLTHHGAAQDQPRLALGLIAAEIQQRRQGRAQRRLHIPGTRDRSAADGDYPADQRLLIPNRLMHRVGRAHVMHQHADIRSPSASRHFEAGEIADHLLVPAHGVQRWQDRHGHLGSPGSDRPAHGLDGIQLVVFDANDGLLTLQASHHDANSVDDGFGPFLHQPVVAGQVRLALAAIDDQGLDLPLPTKIEFHPRGKRRAAHPDDTRRADARADFLGRERERVDFLDALTPLIQSVRFQQNRGCRQSGGMR